MRRLFGILVIFVISLVNLKAQTIISDTYADYSVFETKQTNAYGKEKDISAFSLIQMESKRYTDNYWHSILTINKSLDFYNYLIEVRDELLELDSINKINNIDKETRELKTLKSTGTNCIVKLSSNYSSNYTWGVNIYSTYYYNKYGSRVLINFISSNDLSDSVKLSLKLEQLEKLIEAIK